MQKRRKKYTDVAILKTTQYCQAAHDVPQFKTNDNGRKVFKKTTTTVIGLYFSIFLTLQFWWV